MSRTPPTPPPRRRDLVARREQAVLVLLALAVVAGVAWRLIDYYRVGTEPLAVVPPPQGPTYRVNINAADWVTLALVPGLGEVLSKRIIETRQTMPGGRFAAMEDLKKVPGISDKMLAKLGPYLCLEEPAAGAEPIRMMDEPRK